MARSTRDPLNQHAGFALLETVVAIGVLLVFAAGVAPLFTSSDGALGDARTQSMTTALAAAKLEQLLALDWGYVVDASGNVVPITDTTTDLGTEPPGAGGPGLSAGSPDTVWNSTPGYLDYLDGHGRWAGAGTSPPPTAVYVRRWAVTPLSTSPADTLVLEVLASAVKHERAAPRTGREHRPGDTWLVTFKTRMRQ